jgi:membrane-bound serine protease (ClpP class)
MKVMNDTAWVPLVLQIAGILVIMAEIIIPSGGILSLVAAGLIGYSLYLAFTTVSATAGYLFLAADAVILPLLVYVGLKLLEKSPVTLRRTLSSRDGVTSQALNLESLIGKQGTAVTDLRPSGKALMEGKKVDVVTRGDYISKESKIIVMKVTGNQVIVEQLGR